LPHAALNTSTAFGRPTPVNSLEALQTPGTLAALWRNPPTVKEGTMFQSGIAEWSYYLGCISAAAAIV
jgi:hypothetical protein